MTVIYSTSLCLHLEFLDDWENSRDVLHSNESNAPKKTIWIDGTHTHVLTLPSQACFWLGLPSQELAIDLCWSNPPRAIDRNTAGWAELLVRNSSTSCIVKKGRRPGPSHHTSRSENYGTSRLLLAGPQPLPPPGRWLRPLTVQPPHSVWCSSLASLA